MFGSGTCELLVKIAEKGSLSAAAKAVGMSYRYAWGLVRNVEEHLGKPIVKTRRGGKHGGETELTKAGLSLVADFEELKEAIAGICRDS